MIKVTKKVAAIGASLLILIAVGATVLFDGPAQTTAVNDAVTTAKVNGLTPTKQTDTSVKKDAATSVVAAAPAAVATTTSRPASNNAQTKSVSTPTTTTPKPNPTPAPYVPANFFIILQENSAYTQDLSMWGSEAEQLVIPFIIKLENGFTPSTDTALGCRFLATPRPDHGVLCNVSQKEADGGFLVVQYHPSNAPGDYIVEVTYRVGAIQRTDSIDFSLAELLESSN